MENVPWYKSAIIRQQVVQIIVAALAVSGIKSEVDWSTTVAIVFAAVPAVIAVWTVITRLFKHAPNLTATAVEKERELVDKGTVPGFVSTPPPTRNMTSENGGARVSLLLALFVLLLPGFAVMQGCAGTASAYKAAAGSLPDTAYVVTEHYSAVLKEAADLAALPGTPASVKSALKKADNAVRPFIIGDSATGQPGLRVLSDRYMAVKNAQTEADLQNAVDAAVRELANFIRAVKAARGTV